MGQDDKDLAYRPFKRNNRCKIILEKNKSNISYSYNPIVYGKVENRAFWTFLLRNQTLFKDLEKDFADYRKNPSLKNYMI